MRHGPYRRQTHGCRSRRQKPDMASTRPVRGQHRRYESAASPIACAGSACSDGGVPDPVPVSVNQPSACDTQHYAQAHQHARTSWRFAPDAILPGHRHTGGSRQGHPRNTSAPTVGRPWVALGTSATTSCKQQIPQFQKHQDLNF